MATTLMHRWTCPVCARVFIRIVVTARPEEGKPRLSAFDSCCPKCGVRDPVVAPDAGHVVLAVTYDIADGLV